MTTVPAPPEPAPDDAVTKKEPAAESSSAVVDGVDVDRLAAAVTGCPSVAGLYGGTLGEVATYLPGRRVAGVVVEDDVVRVDVRARWGVLVADLAAQVRTAATPLAGGRRVEIVLADIETPDDTDDSDGAVTNTTTESDPTEEKSA